MDATAATATPKVRLNRFLPYWAVLQADFSATLNSWLYRVWVLLSIAVAVGYLLYRYGAMRVSGMIQPAPEAVGDLLAWVIYGSITLIIALTAGTICSERGSMADSILSRGISRYQYFLGKLHARLGLVLITFFAKGSLVLGAAYYMLHSDALTLHGCAVALLVVASLLVFVGTFGVSVSAMSSNTLVSIAVVWITLYGTGFVLSQLPGTFPSPERAIQGLPSVLKGWYDWNLLSKLMLTSLAASGMTALIGMYHFSGRDV
ncbi:MAG: ABC transporter permease [Planctomycetes bacterium]|nr:ABC transporter permease [Planctomycetota bacterium]